MNKVLTIFGTRPEAIKMAPIIKELNKNPNIIHKSCVTAQHREMLDQVLNIFNITPDYDLDIFTDGQTLSDITVKSLKGLESVIKDFGPDLILVQGDTTTVFAGALAAFYNGVEIGHVEAGLRSGNLYSPYPEEANRKLTGIVSNYHFSPTETSKENLLREGYSESDIFVTGNTSIDALLDITKEPYDFNDGILNKLDYENKKVILLTSHRRENIGKPMEDIFEALREAVEKNEDAVLVYPVHLNPKVRQIAKEKLGNHERIHLIEPLEYLPFANLQKRCCFIVTDSGGIQEEAPTLGKPILVIRKETERPEGIEAGTAKLVGIEKRDVFKEVNLLLNDKTEYDKMANAVNPYGDGKAAERIVAIIEKELSKKNS